VRSLCIKAPENCINEIDALKTLKSQRKIELEIVGVGDPKQQFCHHSLAA
jgi:hypothetical protein